MKKVILGLSLVLMANMGFASNGTGKVSTIRLGIHDENMVLVGVTEQVFNHPSACNSNAYNFTFDASTEVGKKVYAALLSAHATKTDVYFMGTGNCISKTFWTNSFEGLDYIKLK